MHTTQAKQRGPQARPTRTELNLAWARIRAAAESGNVTANALLIALSENKPVISLESAIGRA
ncbi:hypothetical protein ALP04_01932 [Pseudomonas amygdali pv. sesami]|nr:hypothetical protein ALP04_01932 [Pseudomonas amygdali pv. sesami]